ncbi:unnamed protein product [Phytophthora fragariaefolia]|uniref:carbonic anhydrase n=1 Tax=Phytophthora fragariaefolia TaxID=1490495 RepID=A0A9W6WYM6_9STRA|nr:unnamed protein product [Phytophthora fragariaefolia]
MHVEDGMQPRLLVLWRAAAVGSMDLPRPAAKRTNRSATPRAAAAGSLGRLLVLSLFNMVSASPRSNAAKCAASEADFLPSRPAEPATSSPRCPHPKRQHLRRSINAPSNRPIAATPELAMGASMSKVSVSSSLSKVLHHKPASSGAKKAEPPSMLSQSPIDIVEDPAEHVEPLSSSDTSLSLGSASAEMQLVHGGENFQVTWSDREQNYLLLEGKKYYTVQFHFHAPSEHTVNGQARAMELHVVHQADDGALAVVGVFFTEGSESAFLAQFWHEISTLQPGKHDHVALGKVAGGAELGALLDGKLFRYKGSLTTPPYSEGVEWVVVSDMLEASAEQLERYRQFLPSPNARDTQKLNGRKVSPCQCSNVTPMGG